MNHYVFIKRYAHAVPDPNFPPRPGPPIQDPPVEPGKSPAPDKDPPPTDPPPIPESVNKEEEEATQLWRRYSKAVWNKGQYYD